MTEYKEYSGGSKHRSLYIGLLYNLLVGLLVAIFVWMALMVTSYYIIGVHFMSEEMQSQRREGYLDDLQDYVTERELTLKSTDGIGGWIRDNSYVYLLVYQEDGSAGEIEQKTAEPNATDRLIEFPGSRIDEELAREELIAAATENGYHRLILADGEVIVALAEYTENLYYSTVGFVSVLAAGLTFVLILLRYIRVIIERIKRFESDVTIVSEIDMNYEIISEGQDELGLLSGRVEAMRQSMLENIKSEQEAREANTALITSISHDIRTPLTVLMGYIEMMKEHEGADEVMKSYISAAESTAVRLKNLSDDMFKYSLAFGDTEKSVRLEEYDFVTLIEQLLSEHFLLLREKGYDVQLKKGGLDISEGTLIRTDAPNLMRIVDNVFSNLNKYADFNHPVVFEMYSDGSYIMLECRNRVRTDTEGAESNGIGLKSCKRLASLVAEKFEYGREGDYFVSRLVLKIYSPEEKTEER